MFCRQTSGQAGMTIITRRQFAAGLGGAAAWPIAARAQQPGQMRRIGVLMSGAESDPEESTGVAAFQQELQRLGWTEGHNVRFEHRWPAADLERMRTYAAELVLLSPDVILTGSNQVTAVLRRQTSSIPIVFAAAGDALGTGLVTSLAHPGGNITGFTTYEGSLGGKLLELLKEAVPRLAAVGLVYTPSGPASLELLHTVESIGPSVGVKTTPIPARDPAEIERALAEVARERDSGLLVLSGPATRVFRDQIVASATRHRLPAIYPYRFLYISAGGLMSYGPDLVQQYRQAASYVDRILKGEKPGDLPVQVPTRYELIVNLKAAKTIGLTIPESFLLRADEVIE
jgi:putative ABC transport system substrate-binding protein